MDFYVEKAVLDAGVKILFPVVNGVDNRGLSEEWNSYRTERIKELYEQYGIYGYSQTTSGSTCSIM